MMASLAARRLAAEALGTALLLATVVGSGIMAERLAAGNVAVALLANAVATGGALYVLITILGPISGAHFNPAVTLAFALRRELTWPVVGPYLVVQVVGAVVGVVVAHLMFDLPALMAGVKVRTGPSQWFAEGVATFGLLLTILGGVRHAPKAVPALVACYIVAAYWFTASTSFANPAVTVARSLTDSFAGIRPVDVPGFIVAQLAGMAAALAAARVLFTTSDDSTSG
jgi:glycerol uptake facilitator-like aquaporin